MNYPNGIPYKDPNRNHTFDKFIRENFVNGINLVSGGKIFGVEIDTTNLEEVIAALYIMYTYKDYMVKADERQESSS